MRGRRSAIRPTAETGRDAAPGAPWAICITPGPNQLLYMSDAYPGRIYKLTLDGKVLGVLGKCRQAAEAVRLDPRDRVPVGERALRRRAPQLARAEADPASGENADEGKLSAVVYGRSCYLFYFARPFTPCAIIGSL